MRKTGKKYVEASSKVDKNQSYSITDAIKLVKETSITKFDSTIEVALKLNVDPKKQDQLLRGSLVLPNGSGKSKRILVLAKGEQAEIAKNAGADYVGDKDLIEKIKSENWLDFDIIVATPDMMPEVGKIGNILGPRGLMPNPKTGTVTPKVENAIADIKKGMIEYRTDSYGNIHTIIGKASFTEQALEENLKYVVSTISKNKPNTVKGALIQNIVVSSTMGPGIRINKNSFDN
ncbi:MAG: 50S ribosomal protein L1 [Firmicutes bacterium]|nr:50S ribosomal protein L1 [Bacillota bacterium]